MLYIILVRLHYYIGNINHVEITWFIAECHEHWKKNIQFSVLILYLLEALGALSYLRPSVRDIFADLLFQLYATHQRQIK